MTPIKAAADTGLPRIHAHWSEAGSVLLERILRCSSSNLSNSYVIGQVVDADAPEVTLKKAFATSRPRKQKPSASSSKDTLKTLEIRVLEERVDIRAASTTAFSIPYLIGHMEAGTTMGRSRYDAPPQTAGEAVVHGWTYLRLCCAICRHVGGIDLTVRRASEPIRAIIVRAQCPRRCGRGMVDAKIGTTFISRHEKPIAVDGGRR